MHNYLICLLTFAFMPISMAAECDSRPTVIEADSLRLASLNVAHGRGLGMNQMLQSSQTTRENLERVAALLRDIDADLVALQEADGVSKWSGKFDHVAVLSDAAFYPCVVHGEHAVGRLYSFGTAVLSRYPFLRSLTHDFKPSKPTTNKGFSLVTVLWNPGSGLPQPVQLNVISVHLDFSRESVRESQIAELQSVMQGYVGPLVVMGDFNSDWEESDSALKKITERSALTAWEPTSPDQGTYKDGGKRLDWILVSRHLEFLSYGPSKVDVSDHRMVVAEIALQAANRVEHISSIQE